jgi:hypothetical protein
MVITEYNESQGRRGNNGDHENNGKSQENNGQIIMKKMDHYGNDGE